MHIEYRVNESDFVAASMLALRKRSSWSALDYYFPHIFCVLWLAGSVIPSPFNHYAQDYPWAFHHFRATDGYLSVPLDGLWLRAPYLHNGSVPNLYDLLSPVSERPKTFYLGNREYDPVNVGYRSEKIPNGFKVDTSIRGNSNSGHEFNKGSGKGIIGPPLTPDERRALIEYLKTL